MTKEYSITDEQIAEVKALFDEFLAQFEEIKDNQVVFDDICLRARRLSIVPLFLLEIFKEELSHKDCLQLHIIMREIRVFTEDCIRLFIKVATITNNRRTH